jgi:hypothetical protein
MGLRGMIAAHGLEKLTGLKRSLIVKMHTHIVSVCFSLQSEYGPDQTENIPTEELIHGMAKRLAYLLEHPHDAEEAFVIE